LGPTTAGILLQVIELIIRISTLAPNQNLLKKVKECMPSQFLHY